MSDYLDPNNEELLKDFFAEAQGQVESLEQNVLALEQESGNRDAVDEIFRAAHTLKGGAGTVEMTELAEFTHLVEDVLDGVRSGKTAVKEAVIDALLGSIDVIKAMLDARSRGAVYRGDTSGIKATLAAFLPAEAAKRAAPAKPASSVVAASRAPGDRGAPRQGSTEAGSSGLSEYEILELREAAGADRRIFRVRLGFNTDNVMKTVSAIHAFAALRDIGTVLKTVPDFEKLYEDAFYPVVEYFVAVDEGPEELRRKASIPDVVDEISIEELLAEPAAKAVPARPRSRPRPRLRRPRRRSGPSRKRGRNPPSSRKASRRRP